MTIRDREAVTTESRQPLMTTWVPSDQMVLDGSHSRWCEHQTHTRVKRGEKVRGNKATRWNVFHQVPSTLHHKVSACLSGSVQCLVSQHESTFTLTTVRLSNKCRDFGRKVIHQTDMEVVHFPVTINGHFAARRTT